MANRGKYLAACLTLVRAHALAGFPGAVGVRPLASFDGWTRFVRGPLLWLGRADPIDTIARTYASDPERTDLRLLLRLWRDRFGTDGKGERTAREAAETFMGTISIGGERLAVDAADTKAVAETATAFRETLLRIAGRNNVVDVSRFGMWLNRHQGQIRGGLRLVKRMDGHLKVMKWTVCRATSYLRVAEVDGDEKE